MKTPVIWMAIGTVLMGLAWAGPDDDGPRVFPGQEDAMLRKLMGEMLKDAEEERKEMEKPVELPRLDAPELRRLLGRTEGLAGKRWVLGVRLRQSDGKAIVLAGVEVGSPAGQAGLQDGDVLLEVNGIRLRDHGMLADLLQVVQDQELELGVRRGKDELTVRIRPRSAAAPGWDDMPRGAPQDEGESDEVLAELRGMREVMDEMLRELKKQSPSVRPVPAPPQN